MSQLVDFLFTGVAVIPATLFAAGRPDLAMIVFFPLLFTACFAAVWSGDYPAKDPIPPSQNARENQLDK